LPHLGTLRASGLPGIHPHIRRLDIDIARLARTDVVHPREKVMIVPHISFDGFLDDCVPEHHILVDVVEVPVESLVELDIEILHPLDEIARGLGAECQLVHNAHALLVDQHLVAVF
jgi:hypothetical protein